MQQSPAALDDDDPSSMYDPTVIRQAADDKFLNNDVSGAQMVYASALLDWVDDAREGGGGVGVDPEQLREAIATLWLSYANLNQRAKQYKSATEVYEGAVSCPIAGNVGRVWLEYARFAEERGKMRTAQKIYLRALVGADSETPAAVADEQDRNLLWQEFLDMMRRAQNNPNLTMKELKEAAAQERMKGITADAVPDPVSSVSSTTLFENMQDDAVERPEKRQRIDEPRTATNMPSKTHVVTAEAIEAEANDLLLPETVMPPEISAAWYVRDGAAPPAFPDELFSASPPKLQDPTGRYLLGDELALALMERLIKKDEQDASGAVLLEVCRGLWMLTALKEKELSKSIENLDSAMTSEMETMESNLEARLSVAGAAASAIQQMNENERSSFQQSCFQRRQQLLSSLAWDFRNLLCFQQQVLAKLKVPGFEGPSVDSNMLDLHKRICQYLHSAFYLRERIGEKSHQSMLQSQAQRLRSDLESAPPPSSQSPPVASLSPPPQPTPQPITMNLPPPPPLAYATSTMYTGGYPAQPQQQQQMFVPQQPGIAYPQQMMAPPQYGGGMMQPPQQPGQQVMQMPPPYGQPQQQQQQQPYPPYYPPQQQ